MPSIREALRADLLLHLPAHPARRLPPEEVALGRSIYEWDFDLGHYRPEAILALVLEAYDAGIVEAAAAGQAEGEAVLELAVEHSAARGTVGALAGFRDYLWELQQRLRAGGPGNDPISLSVSLSTQALNLDQAIRALARKYPGLVDGEQDVATPSLVLPSDMP